MVQCEKCGKPLLRSASGWVCENRCGGVMDPARYREMNNKNRQKNRKEKLAEEIVNYPECFLLESWNKQMLYRVADRPGIWHTVPSLSASELKARYRNERRLLRRARAIEDELRPLLQGVERE